jgi:DNA repair protein RecN (Recombination protein N)
MAHLKGCGEQQEAFGKTGEELEERRRFLEFQLSEISEIAPRRGEQEVLEAQKKKLRGAEKLRWALGNAEGLLSGEGGIGALLGRLQALLDEARKLDDVALEWKAMVKESDSILGELGRMLSKYVEDIDADPHRLSETEERLDILQRLSR